MIELLDKNSLLEKLTEVSPVVNEYVVSEEYRTVLIEEEINTDSIFYKCLDVFFEELDEYGLRLQINIREVTDLDVYMDLYLLLIDSNMYEIFNNNINIYDDLKNYVELSNSNIDITPNDVLKHFLVKCIMNGVNVEISSNILNILPTFIVSSTFIENTNLVLKKYRTPTSNLIVSVEDRNKFIQTTITNRILYEKAVRSILGIFVSLDKKYLEKTIVTYDLDKVQSENSESIIYSYVNKDNDSLDVFTQNFIKDTIENHERKNTHHVEYYEYTKQSPTLENLVEMTCHHVEVDENNVLSSEQFIKEVDEMISSSIFSNDDKNYIIKFKNVLVKHLGNWNKEIN